MDVHTAHVACQFVAIQNKMDAQSGQVIEKDPPFVKSGDFCMVELLPMKPLCVETFHEFAPLGRFAIRDMKQTVAVGLIKSVLKKNHVEMIKGGVAVKLKKKMAKHEDADEKMKAGHHVAQ